MARVKLTEHMAKKLLNEHYDGHRIRLSSLTDDCAQLNDKRQYVIKVDQGIKHRAQQGLIVLDVAKQAVPAAVRMLAAKGFDTFIAEPILNHKLAEERYLSIERTRSGLRILYSDQGGVDVEQHADKITTYTDVASVPLPGGFVTKLINTMDTQHMSFVEINPLVVRGKACYMLDAAVLADSAGQYQSAWESDAVARIQTEYETERAVAELNANSPASFTFRVLNPNGAVWLLLSGGGASITIADTAYDMGQLSVIGNYGEYSGGPGSEETYAYTKQVLLQMKQSTAAIKALVIAGGVANFTDIAVTFQGIIRALREVELTDTKIFVRRGGPNETEGLKHMEIFLREHDLFGSIHGSDDLLTLAVVEALEYVHA